ncbi:MAG: DUF4493 domain-containing protein [Bacteroidetes bacterium]|uniref:DUF4493 domain-containing protein n=1 Tax=Candidatus Egerieousia excrementavium TaxID=2840778 RepID=A0A9D9DL13_9BACT|nr:DUF4493 domain-containing protein [Candidatus Egerieousia excrementavium]
MRKLVFLAISAALVLSGCVKEGNINGIGEYGSVSIGLSSEGEFAEVKSGGEVNVADFYLKILQGASVVKSYSKYSDVPNAIELSPGSYKVEAGTSADADAEWDQPIYYGSQEFSVSAGEALSLDLTCTLSNMKVTVTCSEAFNNEISEDFEIAITNGKGTLIFDKTKIDAGTSGYFSVGTLTIDLTATRKSTGEEILEHRVIEGGAAKDHFILNFDAQETGSISFGDSGITIDYSLNDREEEIIVPGEDETPVEEPDPGEPEDEYLPTITGDGIEKPVILSKSGIKPEKVDIDIETLNSKTIENILVSISGPDGFVAAVNMMGLGGEFSIVDFEGTAGEARKETLVGLGLIEDPSVSKIKGTSNYTFSIGSFMGPLADITFAEDVVNFKIKVIDSDNKEASATCTINIVE